MNCTKGIQRIQTPTEKLWHYILKINEEYNWLNYGIFIPLPFGVISHLTFQRKRWGKTLLGLEKIIIQKERKGEPSTNKLSSMLGLYLHHQNTWVMRAKIECHFWLFKWIPWQRSQLASNDFQQNLRKERIQNTKILDML